MSPLPDARRMVGDPVVSRERPPGAPRVDCDLNRRACLYGAAMMRKVGKLPSDLSAVDVHFTPPGTLAFVAADATQAELGRFTIPDRVLLYKPKVVALPPADA